MNEADKPSPPPKPTERRFGRNTVYFLIIAVVAVAVIILIPSDLDLIDGELILTERGCQVMTYHGVEVQPLEGSGLCLLRARYRFLPDTAHFVRIHVDTPQGLVKIELPGGEVVSKARR